MQFTEKEIEEIIFADLITNDSKGLIPRGFVLEYYERRMHSSDFKQKIKWFKQLRIEPYGIIDLVGFYRNRGFINVELLELKARPIEHKDFDQILRYSHGLYKYLMGTFRSNLININCILIGTGYKEGHFIQQNSNVSVFEYEFGINGMKFKKHADEWKMKGDDNLTFKKRDKSIINTESIITN